MGTKEVLRSEETGDGRHDMPLPAGSVRLLHTRPRYVHTQILDMHGLNERKGFLEPPLDSVPRLGKYVGMSTYARCAVMLDVLYDRSFLAQRRVIGQERREQD